MVMEQGPEGVRKVQGTDTTTVKKAAPAGVEPVKRKAEKKVAVNNFPPMMEFDENPTCKKCGSDVTQFRYNDNYDLIFVTCARCGYFWTMRPLNHRKPQKNLDSPSERAV